MGKRVTAFAVLCMLAGLLSEARGLVPLQAVSQLPVGYWPLDEAAGPAADFAGTANGTWFGTVNTVTAGLPPNTFNNQNGNTSRAISLVGALPDDYIEIANTAALENLQENSYTISAWAQPASIPPGVDAAPDAAYGIVLKNGYHEGLVYGNGQHFQFDHWKTGDVWAGIGTWNTGFTIAPGAPWHHVAAVWDRTAGEVRIYVDGTLRGTATAVVENNRDFGQNPWRIGIAYGGNGGNYTWPMDGMIDDVRLYNYALTPTQVGILSSGVPTPTGLAASTGGVQSITLTWTAPATPVGFGGYTYNIYRAATPAGPFARIATGVSGGTYTDTTTITTGPPVSFSYMVTAVSVAESGMAGPATGTAILPPPRTKGHTEGLFDDNCACGSTARPGAAVLAGLLGLALLLAVRRSFP